MNPLLSVLIPTVVGREEQLEILLKELYRQKDSCSSPNAVTIQFKRDNKEMTIGEKRELLYKNSPGLYSWQIDDDDDIADNAIQLILESIKSNPKISCITFKEHCMISGEYKSSNHSIRYPQWMDNQDGYSFIRCPFYKDVIRTDIAKSVPFPHIRYNEDEQWSMAIKQLLADEIHIEEELYYYFYEPKESHNERYGITG